MTRRSPTACICCLEQMLRRVCRRRSMAAAEWQEEERRGGIKHRRRGGAAALQTCLPAPVFPLQDLEYSREELSRMMKRCRHKERAAFEEQLDVFHQQRCCFQLRAHDLPPETPYLPGWLLIGSAH